MEKKTYNYKGNIIEAKELTGSDLPCEILDINVPPVKNKQGHYLSYGGKIPKLIVIKDIVNNIKQTNGITITYKKYKNGTYNQTSVLPSNFKLKVLTGVQGKKILDFYNEEKIKNLQYELYHNFYIGSDPEIFVENDKGKVIPAFEFLGSKQKPNLSSNDSNLNGGLPVYWDRFQAEFTTVAKQCLAWQVDSIQLGLKAVYEAANKYKKKSKLSLANVVPLTDKQLHETEEQYITFGCMPSFNVYGLEGEKTSPRELPFRFAGGHIHFGIGKQSQETITEVVKVLDAIVGVACVSLFANIDNPLRRKYYGLPGEHRLPAHGLEYRTLSNAWLCHPLIANLVIDLSRKVIKLGQIKLRHLWKATEEEVINTITNCDVEKAREILKRNKDLFITLYKAVYTEGNTKLIYNAFINGVESIIKSPNDIEGNWDLTKTWIQHSDGKGKNWKKSYELLSQGKKV